MTRDSLPARLSRRCCGRLGSRGCRRRGIGLRDSSGFGTPEKDPPQFGNHQLDGSGWGFPHSQNVKGCKATAGFNSFKPPVTIGKDQVKFRGNPAPTQFPKKTSKTQWMDTCHASVGMDKPPRSTARIRLRAGEVDHASIPG